MSARTASKYSTSLPPLFQSTLLKDIEKDALQSLKEELETYKSALSSYSLKDKTLEFTKQDSLYNLTFDRQSLKLSFHSKDVNDDYTLIAHSSTAPFCLTLLNNTSVGPSIVNEYDPIHLLPVTHCIKAQGPITCQVHVFPGYDGSLEVIVLNSTKKVAKSYSWDLKALMTFTPIEKLPETERSYTLVIPSDSDLFLVHSWISETLVDGLPEFSKFIKECNPSTLKCSQSNALLSYETSKSHSSILVKSSSPFPLCILQTYLLQRAEKERKQLNVNLKNLKMEGFVEIVSLWLSRFDGKHGRSTLERDMVEELKAVQNQEQYGQVFTSPRLLELLAQDTDATQPSTPIKDTYKYPQNVVIYNMYLILKQVCRYKGQDPSRVTSLLERLINGDYNQKTLQEILIS